MPRWTADLCSSIGIYTYIYKYVHNICSISYGIHEIRTEVLLDRIIEIIHVLAVDTVCLSYLGCGPAPRPLEAWKAKASNRATAGVWSLAFGGLLPWKIVVWKRFLSVWNGPFIWGKTVSFPGCVLLAAHGIHDDPKLGEFLLLTEGVKPWHDLFRGISRVDFLIKTPSHEHYGASHIKSGGIWLQVFSLSYYFDSTLVN